MVTDLWRAYPLERPEAALLGVMYDRLTVTTRRAGRALILAVNVPGDLRGRRAMVSIYDVRGRAVRRLAGADNARARVTLVWDGFDDQGLRSARGVYFARVRVGSGVAAASFVWTD